MRGKRWCFVKNILFAFERDGSYFGVLFMLFFTREREREMREMGGRKEEISKESGDGKIENE